MGQGQKLLLEMSFRENSNKLCFSFDLCESMNYDVPAFAQKETPEMFGFFWVVSPRYVMLFGSEATG